MHKVYLSPPYHYCNYCAIDGCDENKHNNAYLDELEKFLIACGIDYRRGPERIAKDKQDANTLMYQAVRESNEYGADIHYVSHTNASTNGVVSNATARSGKARGYRPIIYKGSVRGRKLGEIMIRHRKAIYEHGVTLNESTTLYELRAPTGVSFYEEHVFHDNVEDATWFHAHLRDIARQTAMGFCEYFGITFVDPYAPETKDEKMSETNTGADVVVHFNSKEDANAFAKAMASAYVRF